MLAIKKLKKLTKLQRHRMEPYRIIVVDYADTVLNLIMRIIFRGKSIHSNLHTRLCLSWK